MKKLEDLKKTRDGLSEQLAPKIKGKIQGYVKDAEEDFRKFFHEKGFTFKITQNKVTAVYGDLSAELKYDDKSSTYMGSYFVFDLTLSLPHKEDYTISLNADMNSVRMKTVSANREERLLSEIEEAKDRLENFDNESWLFLLRKEARTTINRDSVKTPPAFASVYELLNSVVK